MEFKVVSELFESLEKTSKRLDKIMILSNFLILNKKDAPLIFDIIASNYQREISKRTIGISLKTVFSVVSFISKKSEKEVEKKFNKVGDIGLVAEEFMREGKQSSLLNSKLNLSDITKAYSTISQTSGTNKNKIKKEILGNLFLSCESDLEHKFLARLLIDDLRVGVSEGVLKEACVNTFFAKIIGVNQICSKCSSISLSAKKCFKCSETIDIRNQEELFIKCNELKIVEIGTPKEVIGLDEFIGKKNEDELLKFALRLNRGEHVIKTENPRALYNLFNMIFEKKYNTLNSFRDVVSLIRLRGVEGLIVTEIIYFRPIKSMLGVRANTIKDSFKVSGKPAVLDYKYDGLRVQIHSNKGVVRLFSRNLDEITKQFPEVVEFIKLNFPDRSFVMDSECVGYDYDKLQFLPFQMLSKRILSKDVGSVSHIKVVVKVFDLMKLDDETLIDLNYGDRRNMLEELFLGKEIVEDVKFDLEKLKSL